jgi:drug/metabolite transporter (DMT)-like permease
VAAVLAILGGLGAAIAWATATVCSSRSSRMIGAESVLGWVMLIGLIIVLPWALAGPWPADVDTGTVAWLVVAGAGSTGGLLVVYRALRVGKVGIVTPIVSTEGAIAAVIAVLTGESLSAAAVGTLAVIAAGVVLSALPAGDEEPRRAIDDETAHSPVAVLYAIAGAGIFGVSLFATGHLSDDVPTAWIVLPARIAGVVAVAGPLILVGRMRLTRAALPLVLTSGICEVAGFVSFTLGARDAIAITAVLASQFATIAAVAAYVLFGERLARVQVLGAVVIVAGVAVLSALQA